MEFKNINNFSLEELKAYIKSNPNCDREFYERYFVLSSKGETPCEKKQTGNLYDFDLDIAGIVAVFTIAFATLASFYTQESYYIRYYDLCNVVGTIAKLVGGFSIYSLLTKKPYAVSVSLIHICSLLVSGVGFFSLFGEIINYISVIISSVIAILCMLKSSIYRHIPAEKIITPKIAYLIPVLYVIPYVAYLIMGELFYSLYIF